MTATDTAVGTPRLSAASLSLGYARRPVVEDLDLSVPDGKVTVIVGANGCGKSTLLRGLARLLRPSSGTVLLDGRSIHHRPSRDVARTLGLLPQSPVAPEGLTVVDLVGRGRHPHHGPLQRWSTEDDAAVARALRLTDTVHLAHRPVDELSGGQRQRVWIAVALAQDTDLLLLDEPTTFLDIAHQVEVLDVLRAEVARGMTVVLVIHDLTLAARYADDLVVMAEGAIIARGAPGEVLTGEVVQRAFGVEARVLEDPDTGRPIILPRSQPLP